LIHALLIRVKFPALRAAYADSRLPAVVANRLQAPTHTKKHLMFLMSFPSKVGQQGVRRIVAILGNEPGKLFGPAIDFMEKAAEEHH
jgi:hypothetical protein